MPCHVCMKTGKLGHYLVIVNCYIFNLNVFVMSLKCNNAVLFLNKILFGCFYLCRWVKVTVVAGEDSEGAERQRLATDPGVVTMEQPGRVTG